MYAEEALQASLRSFGSRCQAYPLMHEDLQAVLGPVLEHTTSKARSKEDTRTHWQCVDCHYVRTAAHILVHHYCKPHVACLVELPRKNAAFTTLLEGIKFSACPRDNGVKALYQ